MAQIQALAARIRAFLVTAAHVLGGFIKGSYPMARVKVLFLTANTDPAARLELNEELRQIRRFLDVSPEWDALEIVHEPEAEAVQLPQLLMRQKPDIIHFAGHADKAGRVQLIGPNRGVSRIEPDALYQLLKVVSADVKLVFFNTCYSGPVAEKVVELVPFCIGTKDAIDDAVAIQFSALFYQCLGFGGTVEAAYQYAQAGVAVALGTKPADERPQFSQNPKADPNRIRLRSPRAEEQKRRYRKWAAAAASAAALLTVITAGLLFPAFGWLSPGVAKVQEESIRAKDTAIAALKSAETYIKTEVKALGGDIEPPEGYPPKDINVTTHSSEEEVQKPKPLVGRNHREENLLQLDAWQNDLLGFQRGEAEELLVVQSDGSFAPPFKSCQYTFKVSSDVRITRAAAFLVRDGGDDTTYRPVYRQMELKFKPRVDREGTLFLDRPRNKESILIYAWVVRVPGSNDKTPIKGRSGSRFGVTLTDLVKQP
jgi:hypothetical protein